MKNSTTPVADHCPLKRWWGCAVLLLVLNPTRALLGADAAASRQIINPLGLHENTLRSLEQSQQKQIQAARIGRLFTISSSSTVGRTAAYSLNSIPWMTRRK